MLQPASRAHPTGPCAHRSVTMTARTKKNRDLLEEATMNHSNLSDYVET